MFSPPNTHSAPHLVETLDVHADIVTGAGLVDTLVVHLNSENLEGEQFG